MLQYIITFIEGMVSFLSPCMLPLLPLYISYFSGEKKGKAATFVTTAFFITGFAAVFCILGLFAGAIGELLHKFHGVIDVICGVVIAVLGLSIIGVIKLPHVKIIHLSKKVNGRFSSFLFGVFFSISHAPCMGAWLGAALVTASASGDTLSGVLLMFFYSLGLGVPFLASALLIDRLSGLLTAVNKNHKTVSLVCGILLILLGVLMATGVFHEVMHTLS